MQLEKYYDFKDVASDLKNKNRVSPWNPNL